MARELIGYDLEDMTLALNAMEDSLNTGERARLKLCTNSLPSESEIESIYNNLIANGFHVNYPSAYLDGEIAVTDLVLTKGSPQWAAIIPLIVPILIIGLIAFSIVKIESIASALVKLIAVAGAVAIILAIIIRAPSRRELARIREIERSREKAAPVPATSKKSTGRQLAVKPDKHLAATTAPKYVTVLSPGQTVFHIGDIVSEESFNEENQRVKKLGLNPATGEILKKRIPQTVGSSIIHEATSENPNPAELMPVDVPSAFPKGAPSTFNTQEKAQIDRFINEVPDKNDTRAINYWLDWGDRKVYLEGWIDKCLAGTGLPPMEGGEWDEKIQYMVRVTHRTLIEKQEEKNRPLGMGPGFFRLVEGGFREFESGDKAWLYGVTWGVYDARGNDITGSWAPGIEKMPETSEKLLPALKPFDPYKFCDYVLRNNVFSDKETFIYSGLSGINPLRVPDHYWAEALAAMGGEFIKTGDLYVVHTPGVERPPTMRAAPTWREPSGELSLETIELLAETEGDPLRKFCCRICGECASKELLEEGKFPERIVWLRKHYAEKHPGIWGKMQTAIISNEPTKPSPPNPEDEMEFVSDSPEFLAHTIDDIGYREKLDNAFKTAIARAKGG